MSAGSPLTCLARDIFEALLDKGPPKVLRLAEMVRGWAAGMSGAGSHWLRPPAP